MTSSEKSDPSISAPNLSDRFPEIFGKPKAALKPDDKYSAKINLNNKEHEPRQSRFWGLNTPTNKRKDNHLRNLRIDDHMMQGSKLNENFHLVKKGVIPVHRLFNKLRRKKYYQSIEKLSQDHYVMIGDVATKSFYECSPLLKKKKNRPRLVMHFWRKLFAMAFTLLRLEVLKVCLISLIKYADKKIPLFDANSGLGIVWNLIVLLVSVAQIFSYSIEKFFGTNLEDYGLCCALVLFLWFDLFVKINTRLYIEGLQILDRRKIFRNFAKANSLTDIVPCLGMTALYFSDNSQEFYDLNLLIILKILSSLEIREHIGDLFIKGDKSQSLYDFTILILTILVWAHFIACSWHYIAYSAQLNDPEGKNWLKSKGIIEKDWSTRYLYSIYWGITTMLTVGYGDISPSNEKEMLFNIWAMLIGCGMFGYSMNRIGEILSFAGEKKRKQRAKMKMALKIMREKEVPNETQTKVSKYLEFVWKQERRENPEHEKEIIQKLSSKLREEILLSTNVKFLKQVEAFKSFSDKSLLTLANYMKKVHLSPEEIIYKEKDHEDTSLYFVIDGALESNFWIERGHQGNNNSIKKIFRKNDYFGVQEVFSGKPRVSRVISLDFSTVFKLARRDILYVLQKNPEEYERFCRLRDMDIIYNNQSFYNIKCESCGFEDHRIDECRFLRFLPEKIHIVSKYINRKRKKRHFFRRKDHVKESSLLKKAGNTEFLNEFYSNYKTDTEFMNMMQYYEKILSQEAFEELDESPKNNILGRPHESDENSDETFPASFDNLNTINTINTIKSMKTRSISCKNLKARNSKILSLKDIEYSSKMLSEKRVKTVDALTSNLKELTFDRVKSFKHYFPWNNVENVSRKYNSVNMRKYQKLNTFN